jgi:hypothetical protein
MVLVQFIAKRHSVRVSLAARLARVIATAPALPLVSVLVGFASQVPHSVQGRSCRVRSFFINATRIRRWKWELFGTAPDPEITSCHIVVGVYSPQSPKFSETSAFGQPRRRASLQPLIWHSRLADANCSRMVGDPRETSWTCSRRFVLVQRSGRLLQEHGMGVTRQGYLADFQLARYPFRIRSKILR